MTESTRRPRIVISTRLYEPEASAAAFRIAALAKALASRADVTVLTTTPPRDAPAAQDTPGVTVSRAPVLRDRTGAIRGYLQYASFDAPLLFRLLWRRADVIVAEAPPTTGLVSLVAARIRRARFVYYPGDVWTDGVRAVGAPPVVARVIRELESFVLRRSSRVLSVSPEVSGRLAALGAPAGSVVLVGHGIDVSIFGPDVEPYPEVDPYFVYTGTMSEVHTPEVFIRAFAMLADDRPDLRLKFFGQGVLTAKLRDLASSLVPGRVEIHGVVPPAEAARWIRGSVAALVSLTPGIGYDYAHPTKAYAAAATGTPVLFAGPESFGALVVSARLGVAVPHDAAAVAEAMRTLLAQRESSHTEQERPRRAQWARDSVSLETVGGRGAAAVLSAVRGGSAQASR